MLGITNQDALSEDLENDPFLNSAQKIRLLLIKWQKKIKHNKNHNRCNKNNNE